MKKPSKKAVGIGVAVVGLIAGTTVAASKRLKSQKKASPKPEEREDEANLFI